MKNIGLCDKDLLEISSVLASFPEVERAVLYGSRAKGNFRPGSDIDLTLEGDGLSFHSLLNVAGALDDTFLPYLFDVSIRSQIQDESLQDHIRRVGVVLYERPQADAG